MVFVSSVAWFYYIIAVFLWAFVFGDDSNSFGYVALACALPMASVLSYVFLKKAIRRGARSRFLYFTILFALGLILLFFYCIQA
jgi:thiol:disulfide interchange protein